MVWSNIPGANVHRGAEADNTVRRAEQAGVKRSTYPSAFCASVQAVAAGIHRPDGTALRSQRFDNLSCDPRLLQDDSSGLLKSKSIGDNTVVRFNNQYCPELGAAMALARQEVLGSHPHAGSADLMTSRPSNKALETFTDVPRLVDTLNLVRRQAPSAPLHHFPHGFGSQRTVRPNMSSPAPGWYYYGENKAVGTTDDLEASAPAPRAVACCPAAHSHEQNKAVQTQAISAAATPQKQDIWREQESMPIKLPAGSCLDSTAMLQLLQQQRDDSQAQGAADQADRASVGCQTRQGDTWRVQIEGCLGKSGEDMGSWAYHDKAWIPAGTHYFDKQAHDALAPKRPPNSPQGNTCPSSASRRQRSPTSSTRRGRAAATSPARPAWDNSPSNSFRAAGPSPGTSPTRAELKKMTASWSPGRRGFVKPDLAEERANRFSESQKHAAVTSKHASKPGKKKKKKASPHKASASAALPAKLMQEAPANTGGGGSIWEGTLAGPSSFLQPVLHSQSNSGAPAVDDSQDGQQSPGSSFKKSNRTKRSKDRKHARKHRGHSEPDGEEADVQSCSQNSPPKILTLGQSPRGPYVSPLKGSPRRALLGRHNSELLVLQLPQRPSSAHPSDAPAGSHSSRLKPQSSAKSSYGAQSSRLSPQDSDIAQSSYCVGSSESGSDLSDGLASEEAEERNWGARSLKADSVTRKGTGRRLFGQSHTAGQGIAGSVSSSRLRCEVQDSLSELERLIEQQHRQLIARGILLPEEPSSDSVSAPDLDFSNLSLDSGMDRLSRLADSLVEGMTPVTSTAHKDQAEHIQEASQQMPRDKLGLVQSRDTAARQLAASSDAESLCCDNAIGCSQCSQSEAAMQAPSQQQRTEPDSATQSTLQPESSCAMSESASESAWQGPKADDRMQLHDHRLASHHTQHDSGLRTRAQTEQRSASQDPQTSAASHMPLSVPLSEAITSSYADTASLVEHSLPHNQRTSFSSQPYSAAEALPIKPASRLSSGAAASGSRSRQLEQAKNLQHAHHAASHVPARSQPSGPSDYELSEREVSASEAGDAPHSAAGEKQSRHRQADDAASASDVASVTEAADYADESAQAGGADEAEQEQREGLLSDSEEEFEKSIAAARGLRPSNVAHTSNRGTATMHPRGAQAAASFSAQCTVSIAAADDEAAAFSTIFRQTPTDPASGELEDEEAHEVWEEEMSQDEQSEYSGGLSEEPSAAHWAEMTETPAATGHI